MYDKRIKIFIILSLLSAAVCVARLVHIQLLPDSSVQDHIAELKFRRSLSRQLKTVRGKILDRKGEILAADEPRFQLHMDYALSCFADENVRRARLLKASRRKNGQEAIGEAQEELNEGLRDLRRIVAKCTHFGYSSAEIENEIESINDRIWNLRRYLAWKRHSPDEDFTEAVPDVNDRLLLTAKVDIAEMHKSWPLFELKTDDDIFTAQLEFTDVDGVDIVAEGSRSYPYASVAAQTIGWVGLATQPEDKELFEGDKLSSYVQGEVCGREDGVEYVCEAILRGRRGELVYDIDSQLISQTETQFGGDVQLTLDIELQQRIEEYLAAYKHDPNCGPGMAAVVIEVASGDILALASIPTFDLNRARYDYNDLLGDPNRPLINRAIYKQYPPGSVVKPLILIAGLETGAISPDEVISCPAQQAPQGWPSCWLYNRYPWLGHDDMWQNNARNAVKGSCNIYFSRLADRIEPLLLQQWLFRFGYGRTSLFVAGHPSVESRVTGHESRELRQAPGQISTTAVSPNSIISSFEQIPTLGENERRLFGIGQGNLRATPLQVANAFAAIARGGFYKPPRLFLDSPAPSDEQQASRTDLGISPQTLGVVYDGMSAVVNESGGTAYKAFAPVLVSLSEQDVKVHGKTGSTEEPDTAWFAGFAQDGEGHSIAIALVVEGGQHGSRDAAPLARDIIQFCIEAGYVGQASPRIGFELANEGQANL
jgi:penicillin-binding protein 2